MREKAVVELNKRIDLKKDHFKNLWTKIPEVVVEADDEEEDDDEPRLDRASSIQSRLSRRSDSREPDPKLPDITK